MWAKISSSLVLVTQTSILAENVSDVRLFLGVPYGRFARNFSAEMLYEFLVFSEVAEKVTNARSFCYCLLELQSFVLRTIKD